MSAHGPREEIVEQAWQQLAVKLELNSEHLSWFKKWFVEKLSEAGCAAEHEAMQKLLEEKKRHATTQEWLDRFQGTASEQSLEIVKLTKEIGELNTRLIALKRSA